MHRTIAQSVLDNFLGNAAGWYKLTIIGFLLVNPIVMVTLGSFVAGWLLVAESIFCLAMALKCYPLQPGGLLALEAVIIGLTSSGTVYHEAEANFEVILLLIFMVAGMAVTFLEIPPSQSLQLGEKAVSGQPIDPDIEGAATADGGHPAGRSRGGAAPEP